MGTSLATFGNSNMACAVNSYTQLLLQAHSAGCTGEQEVILSLSNLWLNRLHSLLLLHLQPPQCPETPNMRNATQ